jgi:hypothetical protein
MQSDVVQSLDLFDECIVYEDNVLGLDVLCAVLVEQLESLAQGNEFLEDGLFRLRDVLHCVVVVAAERLSRTIAALEDAGPGGCEGVL